MDIINHYKNFISDTNIKSEEGSNNIFILGTPRSGTTLIESIIGSCNDATSGGELLSGFKLINEYVNSQKKSRSSFLKILKRST